MSLLRVILKPGKERSITRRHPWIFSGAVDRIDEELADGDPVSVHSADGVFRAMGHFESGSIAVRVLSFEPALPDLDFWLSRIRDAFNLRRLLGLTDNPRTNVYRLVFGEGDGLSGLIVDYYNGTAVLQAHSVGMWRARSLIAEALTRVYEGRLAGVYDKSSETLPRKARPGHQNGYLCGAGTDGNVLENGRRFTVDWVTGQKTGFFIDQRENRDLLARYAAGRRVLNAFCYTGGFSVYAAQAGATSIDSVDSSRAALDLTERNMALNPAAGVPHTVHAADALRYLKEAETRFDLIVLDPPAFAKRQDARHHAIQGYTRINAAALRNLAPGGILFTFSCSQVVDRALFNSAVQAAAIDVGRPVRVLHQLAQPPDHPVSAFHPEGDYLKGLVLRVD